VPHDVRTLYAKVTQYRSAVGGLLGNTYRNTTVAAARVASAVVHDEFVVLSQNWLEQQRSERICDERTVNKDRCLTAT
jgi:hypothetical protein